MKRTKILVVDDERLVLKGCQRVLEASNFQVLTAPSVEEALRDLVAKIRENLAINRFCRMKIGE